ncbi:MAG: class SAM-dependent methyltransferase [Paenibacillaceae bacterium]|jgi:SAM-dependent methyltransferase|nr:class SAM-dependent methyltransferase [Paenibacillaceae bacterium]
MAYEKFAMVYDRLMNDMPYVRWVEFAAECFRRCGNPVTVAELGCGTGSVAIPLSQKGYTVYGIDLSEDMLSVAQSKSRQLAGHVSRGEGTEPVWVQQDMTEWELGLQVDAVISFCDCLNYVTDPAGVSAVFQRTYAGLKPGGLFVFDVHTLRTLEEYAANQPFVYNEEDLSYIWECELEEETCTIYHDLTFFSREPGGEKYTRFDETHAQRAYPLHELKGMLAEAGFSGIRILGDFTWEQADEQTERAFFVAVKPQEDGA